MKIESVLVVPTNEFINLNFSNKFYQYNEDLVNKLVSKATFMPRGYVESNDKYKQIVAYGVIQHYKSDNSQEYFSYTRGNELEENRLTSKMSIGVGGHINTYDYHKIPDIELCIEHGLRREINEELNIEDETPKIKPIGIIHDTSNDVGKFHIGFAYSVKVANNTVEPKEKGIISNGFVRIGDLMKDIDKYESWSQILIEILAQG